MQDFDKANPTIYTNAHIITINEELPIAEAMFVKDGIIEAIGTKKEIEQLKSNEVELVDLKGATIMPGFVDSHTHFALSMFLSNMHDLSGFKHQSNKEVWDFFEKAVKNTEKGEWITCKGVDPILVNDLVTPSIQYLDKIAPDNPVIIFSQSLHSYWANSKAFERAGISKETPNPSQSSYYQKDSSGELTGLIVEQVAFKPIIEIVKEEFLTAKLLSNLAKKVMADYAKNGNTTIVSTGLTINDEKPLILLKHLSDKKPTLLGSALEKVGMLPKRIAAPRHFMYMRHDMVKLLPKKRGKQNDFYDIIGIKHWYDGSPYIGTMYLDSAYLDSELTNERLHIPKESKGKRLIKKAAFKSFIKEYHTKGWQLAIHAQGDASIKEILTVFEEVDKEIDLNSLKHRLEHCLLLPESELDRIKKLNITPSFHINHLYYYGDVLKKDLLGEERTEKILPLLATQNKELKFSLHADQPMFESKPFRLIQTAVERKTKSGDTIGQEQKIELIEAIKAMTIYAAWQINMDTKIGSLEKGKYADFIILDSNPFEVETQQLENIKCLKTFVNGNPVR
jgi:predicted amidohydrolase YtcJ